MDGNSSELEEDEEEGGRGRGGEVGPTQLVPQTPDQEAFLKEHFVTLADLSSSGTAGAHSLKHTTSSSSTVITVSTTNKEDNLFTSTVQNISLFEKPPQCKSPTTQKVHKTSHENG